MVRPDHPPSSRHDHAQPRRPASPLIPDKPSFTSRRQHRQPKILDRIIDLLPHEQNVRRRKGHSTKTPRTGAGPEFEAEAEHVYSDMTDVPERPFFRHVHRPFMEEYRDTSYHHSATAKVHGSTPSTSDEDESSPEEDMFSLGLAGIGLAQVVNELWASRETSEVNHDRGKEPDPPTGGRASSAFGPSRSRELHNLVREIGRTTAGLSSVSVPGGRAQSQSQSQCQSRQHHHHASSRHSYPASFPHHLPTARSLDDSATDYSSSGATEPQSSRPERVREPRPWTSHPHDTRFDRQQAQSQAKDRRRHTFTVPPGRYNPDDWTTSAHTAAGPANWPLPPLPKGAHHVRHRARQEMQDSSDSQTDYLRNRGTHTHAYQHKRPPSMSSQEDRYARHERHAERELGPDDAPDDTADEFPNQYYQDEDEHIYGGPLLERLAQMGIEVEEATSSDELGSVSAPDGYVLGEIEDSSDEALTRAFQDHEEAAGTSNTHGQDYLDHEVDFDYASDQTMSDDVSVDEIISDRHSPSEEAVTELGQTSASHSTAAGTKDRDRRFSSVSRTSSQTLGQQDFRAEHRPDQLPRRPSTRLTSHGYTSALETQSGDGIEDATGQSLSEEEQSSRQDVNPIVSVSATPQAGKRTPSPRRSWPATLTQTESATPIFPNYDGQRSSPASEAASGMDTRRHSVTTPVVRDADDTAEATVQIRSGELATSQRPTVEPVRVESPSTTHTKSAGSIKAQALSEIGNMLGTAPIAQSGTSALRPQPSQPKILSSRSATNNLRKHIDLDECDENQRKQSKTTGQTLKRSYDSFTSSGPGTTGARTWRVAAQSHPASQAFCDTHRTPSRSQSRSRSRSRSHSRSQSRSRDESGTVPVYPAILYSRPDHEHQHLDVSTSGRRTPDGAESPRGRSLHRQGIPEVIIEVPTPVTAKMVSPVDDRPPVASSHSQNFGDWNIDPLLETSVETPDEMWARMKRQRKKKRALKSLSSENTPSNSMATSATSSPGMRLPRSADPKIRTSTLQSSAESSSGQAVNRAADGFASAITAQLVASGLPVRDASEERSARDRAVEQESEKSPAQRPTDLHSVPKRGIPKVDTDVLSPHHKSARRTPTPTPMKALHENDELEYDRPFDGRDDSTSPSEVHHKTTIQSSSPPMSARPQPTDRLSPVVLPYRPMSCDWETASLGSGQGKADSVGPSHAHDSRSEGTWSRSASRSAVSEHSRAPLLSPAHDEELLHQIALLQTENESLRAAAMGHRTVSPRHLEQLEHQIKMLQTENEGLRTAVEGSSRAAAPSPSYHEQLEQQIIQLKTDNHELRVTIDEYAQSPSRSTKQEELEHQIALLQTENEGLRAAVSAAQDVKSDATEAKLHELNQQHDMALQQREEELHGLEDENEDLRDEIDRLIETNNNMSLTNKTLIEDNDKQTGALEAENERSQQQLQRTMRQLDAIRHEHAQMTMNMQNLVRDEIDNAMTSKDEEIIRLRTELKTVLEQVDVLSRQPASDQRASATPAAAATTSAPVRNEDYFDNACQKLCRHVQQWVLRFSKASDNVACRLYDDIGDDKIEVRLDNAMLDGSDVDVLLRDRVRRRDVFMSVVMVQIWQHVFRKYMFGMDRVQRQSYKSQEEALLSSGPARAAAMWRITALTELSSNPSFKKQVTIDHETATNEIFGLLCLLLPPPITERARLQASLSQLVGLAIDLATEMRTQQANYLVLPPMMPEWDNNGDLASDTLFDADIMDERSGMFPDNVALQRDKARVKVVLFPLVVKKGDDFGQGADETVVFPAQVLVSGSGKRDSKVHLPLAGAGDGAGAETGTATATGGATAGRR